MKRLGLRSRITLAFGLGALLLSMLLAAIVYGLTRENLVNQRESSVTERVLANASSVSNQLTPDVEVDEVLATVSTPAGSSPLIATPEGWTAQNSASFGQTAVPLELQETVLGGQPATMRTRSGDQALFVVGVPLRSSVDAYYFEGAPLNDIEDTLGGLAVSLLGAAAVTTLAGASLGFYASRRVLRPLTEVGQAAELVASGRLETRLPERHDPDLGPFTTSFNEMVQALQDRIERDARFASEVSHELRSPLMTLAASMEVLGNSKDVLPERAQTALELLEVDIERFQQLVEDLLEISRFDAGAVHLQIDEVLAADVVRQAVLAMMGDQVPVRVDPDAARMIIAVDKRRFGQVLANLIDNAEKYAGGATSVGVDPMGTKAVRIAVEDRGHGVPLHERHVIFDRFSRGSAGGSRGADIGTGLGLSLVAEHVNLLGGRVWVEDRIDGSAGARFIVELPVVASIDDDEVLADTPSPALPEDEQAVTP
jgi:signal transduction histidine kinase